MEAPSEAARFEAKQPDDPNALLEMVRVTGQVVDVAKANGATIDAVGVAQGASAPYLLSSTSFFLI